MNQTGLDKLERGAWAEGYRHGFMLAASGIPLEPKWAEAPLPDSAS